MFRFVSMWWTVMFFESDASKHVADDEFAVCLLQKNHSNLSCCTRYFCLELFWILLVKRWAYFWPVLNVPEGWLIFTPFLLTDLTQVCGKNCQKVLRIFLILRKQTAWTRYLNGHIAPSHDRLCSAYVMNKVALVRDLGNLSPAAVPESDVGNNHEGGGLLKAFLMPHGFAYCVSCPLTSL